MMLAELLKSCRNFKLHGDIGVELSGISYDSRKVAENDLYVAITGLRTDGRRFATDALARGAAAVAAQGVDGLPDGVAGKVPVVDVEDARKFLAEVSAAITGYPDKEMTVVGITGTNGKTTVTYLLESILSISGTKTAVIGTTGFFDGTDWKKLSHTTPESTDLWSMLKQVRDAGCETTVMEISSHAIALERVWGLDVDTAVFTNLTQDHLDFHADMDEYKEAKFRLFAEMKKQGTAVINIDDPTGREFVERLPDRQIITFSCLDNSADLWMEIEDASLAGSEAVLHHAGLALPVSIRLPGMHNVSNVAAASAVAIDMGVKPEKLKTGIEALGLVPGRLQPVENDRGFFIFVDYAHTPDALKNLISAAREVALARVITLFGCGGDRDRDKRPQMGRVASQLSDFIFVTSDNPRTEDPQAIVAEILAGIDTDARQVIVDRRQAIFEAVKFLKKGDVLLVAGKGHEDYQILGTRKIHFDDREVIKEALDAMP